MQQRPAQPGAFRAEGANAGQGCQAGQVAAAGQLQQNRLGPVAGGVARHDIGACLMAPLGQPFVTPLPGFGFAGHLSRRCLVHLQGELPLLAPVAQFRGDSVEVVVPPVIAVPQVQAPAMQGRQILQQRQQGHGVLSAGHR